MDEMDIGSRCEGLAVREAGLTEVGQGEDGAPLANACPIQMVLCDSHLGHALCCESDAIIASERIGDIKLIESHKDTKRRYYRKETSGEAEGGSGRDCPKGRKCVKRTSYNNAQREDKEPRRTIGGNSEERREGAEETARRGGGRERRRLLGGRGGGAEYGSPSPAKRERESLREDY